MTRSGKLAWGLVVVVAVLHFDFWLWDSTAVLFGFLPVGLAWQAGISIAAAVAWFLVVRLAWPEGVEEWAAESADEGGPTGATAPTSGGDGP